MILVFIFNYMFDPSATKTFFMTKFIKSCQKSDWTAAIMNSLRSGCTVIEMIKFFFLQKIYDLFVLLLTAQWGRIEGFEDIVNGPIL